MGSKGAAEVLYGRQARESDEPRGLPRREGRGIPRDRGQPVRGGAARLHRRHHRPATTRARIIKALGIPAEQARYQSDEEARNIPL